MDTENQSGREPRPVERVLKPMTRRKFQKGSAASLAGMAGVVAALKPLLELEAGEISMAVAYFIPVNNYGDPINDDYCLIYGATLCGMTLDHYYQELCRIADSIGAPKRSHSANGARF
jgi:hypothetical protein